MKKIIIVIIILLSFANGKAQHWSTIGNYMVTHIISLCSDSTFLYAGEDISFPHRNLVNKWDGSMWDSAGANCQTQPRKMVIYNGHPISNVCGGDIASYDGSSWQSFGHPNMSIMGMDVYNNNLYATGYFDTISGVPCSRIARWDGSVWQAIDTTKWSYFGATDCAAIYNGDLYIGGDLSNYNGSIEYLARWDGLQWHNVPGISFCGICGINCMAVYKGELYIGGLLNGVLAGGTGNGIVRWNGSRWDDLQGGVGNPPGAVFAMLVFNNELYVAGNFQYVSGIPAYRIAKWDGSKWCTLGSYIDNSILALTVYDSTIIIGGGFWTIDGDSISYIAKWIGGSYTDSCTSPSGINENELMQSEFYFYPNPSTSTITINYPLSFHPYSLLIKDAIGREVKEEKLRANAVKKEIDISQLASGVYFITLQSQQSRITKKLVKQ